MNHKNKGGLPKNMATRTEALDKLFSVWEPKRELESVPLDQSVGRTLAETQYSRFTTPDSHISGCDGIAVRSADFAGGVPDTAAWRPGVEYVIADTGDDFPDDYDAVIRIEEVTRLPEGGVQLSREEPVRAGENVRARGSMIKEGDKLLDAGLVIRPTDLSALAIGGAFHVPVWKKPVVAFLPTGSELIAWGNEPKRGEKIDSNSLTVTAMLREMGAEPLAMPITRDDPELLRQRLHEALKKADVVVINGGSSKGSEDFNTRLIRTEGEILQYQVAAVPGRPMALGIVAGKPVINLPGPPLAAYFGTDWCLRAIVDRWLCHGESFKHTVTGTLTEDIAPGIPMDMLRRLQAVRLADGSIELRSTKGPGCSTADVMASNAQYVIPRFSEGHAAGESLTVELLR